MMQTCMGGSASPENASPARTDARQKSPKAHLSDGKPHPTANALRTTRSTLLLGHRKVVIPTRQNSFVELLLMNTFEVGK
jgi:hypothetical protein